MAIGEPNNHISHRQFYEAVYLGLFEHSERLQGLKPVIMKLPKRTKLSDWVYPAPVYEHGNLEVMGAEHKACLACIYAGRRSSPGTTRQRPRKALVELSINTIRGQKRPDRIPRSTYGCELCDVRLCQHKTCWAEHIRDRQ